MPNVWRLGFGILFVIFNLSLVITPEAGAVTFDSTGNPNDMPTGTVLTHLATFETLSYCDPAGTLMTTAEPSGDRTDTVTSEYGFSGPGTPADNSVSPGGIVWTYYCTTHEGNATDSNVSLKFRYDEYAGASGWVVQLYINNAYNSTLEAGTTKTITGPATDNSEVAMAYRVQVTTEASGAPNDSYINLVTTLETTSTPVGKYTGGNAYTYGGWSTGTDLASDQTSAPILILTRASTVDAPTAAAGYTGGIHDAVPGSVITFTLTYTNEGSASAESVIIVDRIPTNTKLAHFNANGTGASRKVNITALQGNATGWNIRYSTIAEPSTPSKVYGNTADWSGSNGGIIGSLTTGTEQYPSANTIYSPDGAPPIPYDATWVKWEKASIPLTEDNQTLTWGATIR
jgi:uncharacterized repeat protein (TIGR01451 family)